MRLLIFTLFRRYITQDNKNRKMFCYFEGFCDDKYLRMLKSLICDEILSI